MFKKNKVKMAKIKAKNVDGETIPANQDAPEINIPEQEAAAQPGKVSLADIAKGRQEFVEDLKNVASAQELVNDSQSTPVAQPVPVAQPGRGRGRPPQVQPVVAQPASVVENVFPGEVPPPELNRPSEQEFVSEERIQAEMLRLQQAQAQAQAALPPVSPPLPVVEEQEVVDINPIFEVSRMGIHMKNGTVVELEISVQYFADFKNTVKEAVTNKTLIDFGDIMVNGDDISFVGPLLKE